MKKFIILMACSISFLYFVSVSAETVDGFRGIKCGDPLEKWQKEMKYEGENKANQTKAYVRKNDSLQIGNAKLLHVTYIFSLLSG
jgi:hypothetical protein